MSGLRVTDIPSEAGSGEKQQKQQSAGIGAQLGGLSDFVPILLCRWLTHHSPQAKRLLVECLVDAASMSPRRLDRECEAEAYIRVQVEAMGSGVVIANGLAMKPTDSVFSLEQSTVIRMVEQNPGAKVTDLRLFNGQGGAEFLQKHMTLRQAGIEDGATVAAVVRTTVPKRAQSNMCVRAVCVAPDSKIILTGTWDGMVRAFDLFSATLQREFVGHDRGVNGVAVSPDSSRVVSVSNDSTGRIWDFDTGECLHVLEGHRDFVSAVTITADGRTVVTAAWDESVRLWNMEDGCIIREVPAPGISVSSVSLSPNGLVAALGRSHKNVTLISLSDGGTRERMLEGHADWVKCVAMAPEANIAVTGSDDCSIGIFNTTTGNMIDRLREHTAYVRALAISKDGRFFVSGSDDNTARVWRFSGEGGEPSDEENHAAELVRVLQGHASFVRSVAFSPDGKFVVTGSDDHTARVWSLETGALVSWVNMAAFS
eukprot:INCI14644.1.p1 GENE.INCI14644.1~~INCI14644.1.p1  ORF type:complete len:484 (+),score=82.23 INCI14644.1:222-1673(+)